MRTIRTTLAAMLMVFALAATQFDAQAQARRSTTTSRTSSSNDRKSTGTPSVSRSSSSQKSSVSRSTSANRTVSQDRKAARPAATATRPAATATRPAAKPSTTVTPTRPANSQVTRPASPEVTRPAAKPQSQPAARPHTKPAVKPATKPAPIVRHEPPGSKPAPPRVHPRDRDFMHYNAPSYFWTGHNHYYGHKVRVIPSHAHRYVHYGVTYYCYNDIWYRPYSGYYVVCRPPFGTVLAANLIADMTWAAVRLSYYNTVLNTYSQINENNEYIAQQNAVIAQNNATIAAQNAQIAAGQAKAQEAYLVANELGLVQSYGDASSNYYYQDGVFYVADKDSQYKVIVPPAGAYVETIPEDFDMVTLADGNEYYKVDDTVYRITIIDGKPWFEVLGQMYI